MTRLYRIARSIVRRLPNWLLRLRPFSVYEIRLSAVAMHATPSADLPCRVRWVSSAAEASALKPLAIEETISLWDGHACRAASVWCDDRIVGCVWIARQTFDESDLGLEFTLGPGDAWLFAAHVDSELRNRGLYSQLLHFLITDLRSNGVERILLGVSFGNEISRRAHVRQRAVKIGAIVAVRSLGICFCLCTGKVKRASPPLTWRRSVRLRVER